MFKENQINGAPEQEPSGIERKKKIIGKLREELKVFCDNVLVIDMSTYNKEKNPPEEQADILVQTKKDIKYVRDYLNGEDEVRVIREEPSFLFTEGDIAFLLRIIH